MKQAQDSAVLGIRAQGEAKGHLSAVWHVSFQHIFLWDVKQKKKAPPKKKQPKKHFKILETDPSFP